MLEHITYGPWQANLPRDGGGEVCTIQEGKV